MPDDPWTLPQRPATRTCDRCGGTFELSSQKPGWVATSKPRPAWVCPDYTRETGMQPGGVSGPPGV